MTDFADPLIFGGSAPPVGALRGQLVIAVDGAPWGPRPNQRDNRVFIDELEHFPLDWQERILDIYQAMGMNEVIHGAPFTNGGYDGQYPAADWRENLFDIKGLMSSVIARGMTNTLVVLPDCPPYFDGWQWALSAWVRDFGYVLQSLEPYVSRLQLEWECVTPGIYTEAAIRTIRGLLPNTPLFWHNPPGHLSPGISAEDEQQCWRRAAAAGIAGLALQASPPGSDTHLPPIEQLAYDLNDMRRRFNGLPGSPWGGPILGLDGQPLRVYYREGVATTIYHYETDPSIAHVWAQAALSVPGITESGDGA